MEQTGDLNSLVDEDLAWLQARDARAEAADPAVSEGRPGVQGQRKRHARGRRWKPFTSMTGEEKRQLQDYEERKVRRADAVVKPVPRDARGRIKPGTNVSDIVGNAPRTLTTDVIDKQKQLETEVLRLAAAGGLVVMRPATYHAGEGVMGGLGGDAAFLLGDSLPQPAAASASGAAVAVGAASSHAGYFAGSGVAHADSRSHGPSAEPGAAQQHRSSSCLSAASALEDYSFIHKEALDLGEEDLESMDRPSLIAVVQALQRQVRGLLGSGGGGTLSVEEHPDEGAWEGAREGGHDGDAAAAEASGPPSAKRPRYT